VAADRLEIEPEFRDLLAAHKLDSIDALADPALGETVVRSRTTSTARVALAAGDRERALWVKRYYYPTWGHRLRGAFRTTFRAVGRARREWLNLASMPQFGFGRVFRVALGERRIAGFLAVSVLATEEVYGALGLDAWLGRELESADRIRAEARVRAVVERLATAVGRMHHEGRFIDRNLDSRNILVAEPDPGRFAVYNIDSPRGRTVRGRRAFGNGVVEDLARLDVTSSRLVGTKTRARFLKTYMGPEAKGWRRLAGRVLAAEAPFKRRARARFEESISAHDRNVDEDRPLL
jgi:hypothetical protein